MTFPPPPPLNLSGSYPWSRYGVPSTCLDHSNVYLYCSYTCISWGWSGGAMVLGKLPVPGRPTILITVGQGPTALAVGAGGGCLDIFTLIYPFFPLSPSLWKTARYRLKYCLKGPFNPKQPTNLHILLFNKCTQCTCNCTWLNIWEIATVFFWSTLPCENELE